MLSRPSRNSEVAVLVPLCDVHTSLVVEDVRLHMPDIRESCTRVRTTAVACATVSRDDGDRQPEE
jgi:hypothetical protein